jgi:hypothetical protein
MISTPLQQLFVSLSNMPKQSDWSEYDGARITTNKITNSVGSLYERLRYVVDYQEEHTIRRAAIERIVKRLVRFSQGGEVGLAVLEELVHGRYIENDVLPERVAVDVQQIIDNYKQLESRIDGASDILWAYAAVDIEQYLFPSDTTEPTFLAVFQSTVQHIKQKEHGVMSDETFNLQVYIACRRMFLRESHSTLNYSLFRMMQSGWDGRTPQSEEVLDSVASHFLQIQVEIRNLMKDPLQWKISSRLKNEVIYFSLISDIVRKYGSEAQTIFADPPRFAGSITSMLERIYHTHKDKVSKSGTRAIVYILITKIIVGLAVELPYEIFILQEINYLALGINMAFFPLLMVLMTKTVSYPGTENTDSVLQGLQAFVEGAPTQIQYISVTKKTALQKVGHALFSLTFFTLTFGATLYTLDQLAFNNASIALFILFLCIVTYMGIHIRRKSREWILESEDESFVGLVWFLLVMPVTRTGQWISERLSSVNIFVFVLDFILETPFKIMLGSFDSFVSFVRESRRDAM